jgi:hypothetical protein
VLSFIISSRFQYTNFSVLQNTVFTENVLYSISWLNTVIYFLNFLIIEPNRCTNFSKVFILEWNSTSFGQFLCPSSGVFHCTHRNFIYHTCLLTSCEQEQMLLLASCQQTSMTYTIAVCTVENSWWWTEELPETCRVSFQNKNVWEISASSWFYYKKIITIHSQMNVKFIF